MLLTVKKPNFNTVAKDVGNGTPYASIGSAIANLENGTVTNGNWLLDTNTGNAIYASPEDSGENAVMSKDGDLVSNLPSSVNIRGKEPSDHANVGLIAGTVGFNDSMAILGLSGPASVRRGNAAIQLGQMQYTNTDGTQSTLITNTGSSKIAYQYKAAGGDTAYVGYNGEVAVKIGKEQVKTVGLNGQKLSDGSYTYISQDGEITHNGGGANQARMFLDDSQPGKKSVKAELGFGTSRETADISYGKYTHSNGSVTNLVTKIRQGATVKG